MTCKPQTACHTHPSPATVSPSRGPFSFLRAGLSRLVALLCLNLLTRQPYRHLSYVTSFIRDKDDGCHHNNTSLGTLTACTHEDGKTSQEEGQPTLETGSFGSRRRTSGGESPACRRWPMKLWRRRAMSESGSVMAWVKHAAWASVTGAALHGWCEMGSPPARALLGGIHITSASSL